MNRSTRRWSGRSTLRILVIVCGISALLGMVQLHAIQKAGSSKLERPIAMDAGRNTDFFVLDINGNVHRLVGTQNSFSEQGTFALPSYIRPGDMTYSFSAGQESLLIAGVGLGRGIVARVTSDGKLMNRWFLSNVCAGIDFNTKNHSAYVATSDSNEIYRVDLQSGTISAVTQIFDARRLGPLVLDNGRQDVYVADLGTSSIYRYSLITKKTKLLVSGLSAPSALRFDDQTGRLYIADAGRRKIFTVDTRAKTPKATEFASGPLKSPSGIAPVVNGGLAVSDLDGNAIFVFSNEGKLLFRFP